MVIQQVEAGMVESYSQGFSAKIPSSIVNLLLVRESSKLHKIYVSCGVLLIDDDGNKL